MNKTTNILLFLCLLGIVYIIYYQNISFPNKLENCSSIATGFEKARNKTLDVTNEDISGYMKNIVSCIVD